MLELIVKDVPIGSALNLYLVSGETITGILEEVGQNYVIVDVEGSKKRFFETLIGGWDIVSRQKKEEGTREEVKSEEDDSNDTIDNENVTMLAKRFRDSLSNDEKSFFFTPNANIVFADKKKILIHLNDEDTSLYIPYKFIASKGILNDIDDLFLSGNDASSTSIPVYVGLFSKDDTHVYPNIVLEPGTLSEYCDILLGDLLHKSSLLFLAKNLSFILWKGCRSGKSKNTLRALQNALRSEPEKDVLSDLNKQIEKQRGKGVDVNPLLTRKAQWLSSKNMYDEAIKAYIELIESLKDNPDSTPQSISHNYTQLAQIQIRVGRIEEARSSLNYALQYNPSNIFAQNALNKLDSPDESSSPEIETPYKKLLGFIDSVLIDDIEHYEFSDPEALACKGAISLTIADRLLAQAESEDTTSSFLEATKAYYNCVFKEDEDITNYATAAFRYANLKAYSLYNSLVSNSSIDNTDQRQIIDSAYCYFVSSINLCSLIGRSWAAHFRDYLRLRLYFYVSQKPNANTIFELPLDEFILTHQLNEDRVFLLECTDVLVSLGARCPAIKEGLHGDISKSLSTIINILESIPDKEQYCKSYCTINICPHIRYDGSLEQMLIHLIDHRAKKIAEFDHRIVSFKDRSAEALFEVKYSKTFSRIRKKYAFIFTPTDKELFIKADNIMQTLSVFKSRTIDERQIIVTSIRAQLSDNLNAINNYSSYLCSDLLRSLWKRLIESKYLSMKAASSALQSELKVSSDGDIILNSKGGSIIPISVSNEGRSTIDKFKVVVTFSELNETSLEYTGKRLSPGEAASVFIEIPDAIKKLPAYDFSVDISGLIINTWSSSKRFSLTVSLAKEVTFKLSEIKWDYQLKETRVDMFKGRTSDIDRLYNTFTSSERRKIPVVFGLTRTGKSSILLNLKKKLEGTTTEINGRNFVIIPIYIDLSEMKSQYVDHDSFMYQLKLKCDEEIATKVGWSLSRYKINSLIEVINFANTRKIYPIFMFDEFSWVTEVLKVEGNEFLKSIREYAIEQKAGFIYAGTYDILDIIRDPVLNPSGAFMNIDEYKIYNIKDTNDAEALMRAMEPQLVFTASAIKSLHDYSGDVPYWIQMICYFCACYAFSHNRPVIGLKELEDVIKGILGEDESNGVKKVSDIIFEQQQILSSDPKETKALLYSIAYLMKDTSNKNGVSWSRLKEFWIENNYNPNMESIVYAKERLEDRLGLLSKDEEGNRIYRFSVGLFRRWCAGKDVFSEFDRTNNK